MHRLRVALVGGGVVGGGLATFYTVAEEPAALRATVRDYFDAWHVNLPSTVAAVIPPEGDIISAETGDIVDVWSVTDAPLTVTGAGAGGFAMGVGARSVWNTDGRTGNRRVRGSTFMVPLVSGSYESDGTILQIVLDALRVAATGLVDDLLGTMVVWTRPTPERAGKANLVVSASVPDRVTWLRSRRT